MLIRENFQVLIRIQLAVIVSYLPVKFLLRPFILENDYGGFIEIFAFSYPNFCEAVAGSILVVFVVLNLNEVARRKTGKFLSNKSAYIFSIILAGSYVMLQEFKIHNIGGQNIYDPYDVLFSAIGLIVVFFLFLRIKPCIKYTDGA